MLRISQLNTYNSCVGTVSGQLRALGDDGVYINVFGVLLPSCAIAAFGVGTIIDRFGPIVMVVITCALSTLAMAFNLIPSLPVQVRTLLAAVRTLLTVYRSLRSFSWVFIDLLYFPLWRRLPRLHSGTNEWAGCLEQRSCSVRPQHSYSFLCQLGLLIHWMIRTWNQIWSSWAGSSSAGLFHLLFCCASCPCHNPCKVRMPHRSPATRYRKSDTTPIIKYHLPPSLT